MSLRDPSVAEWWEAVRGQIEGQPAATPLERAIVTASRAVLAASLTLVAVLATLIVLLVR